MTARYSTTAIALHWLMVPFFLATLSLGMYMHDLKFSALKLQLFSYHKWMGVTLLLLALFRLAWRFTHTPPSLQLKRWQQRAVSLVHAALYCLFFALPVSGWLMSSAKGVQTVWLGLIPLPDLLEKNKVLGHQLESVHASLSYALMLLITLHVAAALKHYFIDRDGVMSRMLPSKGVHS